MTDLTSIERTEQMLGERVNTPLLLFKHSTRCPISAGAWREFYAFREAHPGLPIRHVRVLVVEHRPVSEWLAQRLGITHASPQLMLIVGGRVVWHASHFDITRSAIEEALEAQGL